MDNEKIEIKNLSKTYTSTKEHVKALDKVNLTINKGEIFGVLGQNGAGKTTLINILSTLLIPDTGSIDIFGIDALKKPNDVRRIIGYAGQDSEKSAYFRLTAFETLVFFSYTFRDVKKEEIEKQIRYMSRKIGFSKKLNSQFSTLSGGQMQTVMIMRAMIHKPLLCFLDEPTKSLDPVTARKFRNFLRDFVKENGMTVILTTHNMQEAEDLCDRLAFINKGKIKFVGSPSEFKRIVEYTDKIIIETPQNKALSSKLSKIKYVVNIKYTSSTITLYTKNLADTLIEVSSILKKEDIKPKITVRSVSVEDAFVKLMENGK